LRGPRYHVPFRRRRENLTDYHMRKTMIRSNKLRIVVRLSSKYIYIQLIEPSVNGDRVLASVCSKELKEFGWNFSYSNTSSAYLSGLLLGKKAFIIKINEGILDIGLRSSSSGSRVFAVLKGLIDMGLKVPHNKQILPSDERIRGEHIAAYAIKLREEDEQRYERLFCEYLSKGIKPEQLPEYFDKTRENILNFARGER